MNYNTRKYDRLSFEIQKIEFDKSIKGDKLYYSLEVLRNLSFYNKLLDVPEDVDLLFSRFSNFFVPIVSSEAVDNAHPGNGVIPLVPTGVTNAIGIDKYSEGTGFIKLQPGEHYGAIGIYIPYKEAILSLGVPKKPVDIDFASGVWREEKEQRDSLESSVYGGKSKALVAKSELIRLGGEDAPRAKTPDSLQKVKVTSTPKVSSVKKRKAAEIERSGTKLDFTSLKSKGKVILFEEHDDPFGKVLQVLKSLESRAVGTRPHLRKKVRRKYNIDVAPKEYSSAIPEGVEVLAKRVLGATGGFANIEDLYTQVYRSGKGQEFFGLLNGLEGDSGIEIPGIKSTADTINYEPYFQERLLAQRKKLAKSEQELQEMYRKDKISGDKLFAEMNIYIRAIKGNRINFLRARPTEFDELLCPHYVEMKNQLLGSSGSSGFGSANSSGSSTSSFGFSGFNLDVPVTGQDDRTKAFGVEVANTTTGAAAAAEAPHVNIDYIIEKFGSVERRNDGTYCSLCGDVIVLEHNFLGAPGPTSGSDSGVPRDEVTDFYFTDIFRILTGSILTEMNLQTLGGNIIKHIHRLILEDVADIRDDTNGIDAHTAMYTYAALASLSILDPEVLAFKAFRDGTKKLTGNAIAQQKATVNEAVALFIALKGPVIKASTAYPDVENYKYKLAMEAFPKVHALFAGLLQGEAGAFTTDDTPVPKRSSQDLEGYNFYSAAKMMDNIVGFTTGEYGAILKTVNKNFEKNGIVGSTSLFKRVIPGDGDSGDSPLGAATTKLLFDHKGKFKLESLHELVNPMVLSENQKHDIVTSGGKIPKNLAEALSLYTFPHWRVMQTRFPSAPTISAGAIGSFVSSYGIIEEKHPEQYFCIDYNPHAIVDGVCLNCGWRMVGIGKTPNFTFDKEYSQLREFFNVYSVTCPEIKHSDSENAYCVGNSLAMKTRKERKAEISSGSASSLHDFNKGVCSRCKYSVEFGLEERLKFFNKYKKTLVIPRIPVEVNPSVGLFFAPKPQGVEINVQELSKFSTLFEKVVTAFKIKNKKRLETLLSKDLLALISITILYFNGDGAVWYSPNSEEEKIAYTKNLILEGMLKYHSRGEALIRDDNILNGIPAEAANGFTLDDETALDQDSLDDVTYSNGEDELEDSADAEDDFDLALDEEDRFDAADAEG